MTTSPDATKTPAIRDQWVEIKGHGTIGQIIEALKLAHRKPYPVEWFGLKVQTIRPPFQTLDSHQTKIEA